MHMIKFDTIVLFNIVSNLFSGYISTTSFNINQREKVHLDICSGHTFNKKMIIYEAVLFFYIKLVFIYVSNRKRLQEELLLDLASLTSDAKSTYCLESCDVALVCGIVGNLLKHFMLLGVKMQEYFFTTVIIYL